MTVKFKDIEIGDMFVCNGVTMVKTAPDKGAVGEDEFYIEPLFDVLMYQGYDLGGSYGSSYEN